MNNNEAGPSTAEPPSTDVNVPGEAATTTDDDAPLATRNQPAHFYKTALLLSLDDLIRTLDLVVWAELALVYFMEYVHVEGVLCKCNRSTANCK
jgi:hypothetical protein